MKAKLDQIREQALAQIKACDTTEKLNEIRVSVLGKKGELTSVLKSMKDVPAEDRPKVGQWVNETRQEIEKIRGVKCDHAINELIEYSLVCEVGRLDVPGRPLLFGTTEEFLRCFGVQSLDDLPMVKPEQMEDFKKEAEEEIQLRLDI